MPHVKWYVDINIYIYIYSIIFVFISCLLRIRYQGTVCVWVSNQRSWPGGWHAAWCIRLITHSCSARNVLFVCMPYSYPSRGIYPWMPKERILAFCVAWSRSTFYFRARHMYTGWFMLHDGNLFPGKCPRRLFDSAREILHTSSMCHCEDLACLFFFFFCLIFRQWRSFGNFFGKFGPP